jgi:hypothetical protein
VIDAPCTTNMTLTWTQKSPSMGKKRTDMGAKEPNMGAHEPDMGAYVSA